MTDGERHRFRVEESEGIKDREDDLDFEEPREKEGPQFPSVKAEFADPEHRDGLSALLDDEAHERAVREAAKKRRRPVNDPESER
jgi:hypothetical protein